MNSPRNRIEHLFGRDSRRERAHDPFKTLVEAFFPEIFRREGSRSLTPSWNVKETEEAFEVTLGVPGYAKEDIKVAVENGALVVRAKHETEHSQNSFSSGLMLPEGVDPDLIQAEMKNGLLKVTIPRPESHKPKEIDIKDAD